MFRRLRLPKLSAVLFPGRPALARAIFSKNSGSTLTSIGTVERAAIIGVLFFTATGAAVGYYMTRHIPLPYAALPSFSRGLRAFKTAARETEESQKLGKKPDDVMRLRDQWLAAERELDYCLETATSRAKGSLGLVLILEKLSAAHMALLGPPFKNTEEEVAYFRQRAEAEYLKTMEILVQNQGRETQTLIRPMVGLSELYSKKKQHRDAVGLLLRCHELTLLQAKSQGTPDVESTGIISQRLTEAYRSAGAYSEAITWNKRALTLCEQHLGTEHPELANLLSTLCDSLCALGRNAEAKPFAERALSIAQAQGNPQAVYAAQYNLGQLNLLLGANEEGTKLIDDARVGAEVVGSAEIEELLKDQPSKKKS